MKLINEIGNTYGYLTVIDRVPNEGTRAKWKCQCKCGNIVEVIGKSLRNGSTRSCGCFARELLVEKCKELHKNMIGKNYGFLTVIDYGGYAIKPDGRKDRMMKCKCNLCGSIKEVRCADLTLGRTKSCGCMNSVGNTTIKLYLQAHNIEFKSEYKIDTCKDIYPLPFDFAIIHNNNIKCLIEYQGIQHFTCEHHGWDDQDKFENIQKHDKIKYNYCKDNNINLQYITYQDNIIQRLEEILNGL